MTKVVTYKNRGREARFRTDATQEVLAEIQNSDAALFKALDILFSRQTFDERLERTSKYKNMKGFRWSHAKAMSDIAVSLYEVGRLTDSQKAWLREGTSDHPSRIGMYWEQLIISW